MQIKLIPLFIVPLLLFATTSRAQGPEIKFIADALVVQADGTYEADPDLATLIFDISSQDKDLKPTYDKAAGAMQKIVNLAEKNGLKREDVSSGGLTVRPYYSGDRKKNTRSFLVQGQISLKVRDFSKLGVIMDGSITEGITDFRSLNYSLADEEAAKQHAVGEAMHRAIGRANAALEQKGQKVGVLQSANVDVEHLIGVSEIQDLALDGRNFAELQAVEVGGVSGRGSAASPPPPPPPTSPLSSPQKIQVGATVQCAFQIQ